MQEGNKSSETSTPVINDPEVKRLQGIIDQMQAQMKALQAASERFLVIDGNKNKIYYQDKCDDRTLRYCTEELAFNVIDMANKQYYDGSTNRWCPLKNSASHPENYLRHAKPR